ncbi:MAG: hypothetical protein GX371_06520 [Bacteroidales bacterium]|nr:hypothetical protein [Bacteroidales bacterium]
MKSNLSRNALIGLAFIASLVMIYFGINFLKGINIFKKQNQYYAVFDDVSKLLISSPIYVKGYQIGLINEIKMIDAEPMRFLVGMNLTEDLPITEGSYLEYGIDMFGASTANLVISPTGSYMQSGDTLTGTRETGLMHDVAAVMPMAGSLLTRIDSVLYSINRLMQNPAWEQSIEGIEGTISRLNRSSESLNRMMTVLESDLPEISRNLNTVAGNLSEISSDLNQLDMKSTFASIDETVDNLRLLTRKINSNDNSLGLLLNDSKLHDSLNVTIDEAARLLEDIRLNPDRYLTIRVKLF